MKTSAQCLAVVAVVAAVLYGCMYAVMLFVRGELHYRTALASPLFRFRSGNFSQAPLWKVTVVTAYFNIGKFQKGTGTLHYFPKSYHQWFSAFGRLKAPLVVYCDTEEFENATHAIRKPFSNITKVIRVNRTSLWSWRLRPRIASIYAQPSYPKYQPNTVNPDYPCAMHSKMAVMEDAILNNYFPAEYYQWIDIGCYRDILADNTTFGSLPPPDLHPDKVAYGVVFPRKKPEPSVKAIFRGNQVWVGGSSFLARRAAMLNYTRAYRLGVLRYLAQGESDTDQQNVFALSLQAEADFRRSTGWAGVQEYPPVQGRNPWFSICYLSRKLSLSPPKPKP